MNIIQSIYLGSLALLSTIATSSEVPLNPGGCLFAQMQAFYMKELGIKNSVQIKNIRQRMPDPNTHGYTKQLGKGSYLISLANGLEPSEIRITMAHELVHVKQMENGQIKKSELKKHYDNRSFENEAFRLSIPLAVKFYTKHVCQKNNSK